MTAWFSCLSPATRTSKQQQGQPVLRIQSKTNVFFTGNNMSGGNKAVELQLQMRQNADDLHSFMRELESWETDIKKKDEELRTGGIQDVQVCSFCRHPSIHLRMKSFKCCELSVYLSCSESSHLCATKTTKLRWETGRKRRNPAIMATQSKRSPNKPQK